MSRNFRRSEPPLRPKKRIELSTEKLALRIMLLGIAILTASLAFSGVFNSLIATPTGWQQIAPEQSETGAEQDFLLCYNIGQTELSAKEEVKALSSLYGQAMDHGCRALANTAYDGYVNLSDLNSQPNTALAVDPLLYAAFQTIEASGSRMVYFAPLMESYRSLFSCADDETAAQFDTEKSGEMARFAQEIASFALDSEAVQVRLLPENTLRLEVSPEYLDYARENELESFVDLGLLRNAFLCDAVAEELEQQGYVNGYLTSFDGFTRALCQEEFGLNVFDFQEGQGYQVDTALYQGPCTVVSCRSFPILDMDQVNYYTYADGSVRAPYFGDDGLLHTACPSLNTLSRELSAAELAIRTLEAYAGTDAAFPSLEEFSWVSGGNDTATYHGEDFKPAE